MTGRVCLTLASLLSSAQKDRQLWKPQLELPRALCEVQSIECEVVRIHEVPEGNQFVVGELRPAQTPLGRLHGCTIAVAAGQLSLGRMLRCRWEKEVYRSSRQGGDIETCIPVVAVILEKRCCRR